MIDSWLRTLSSRRWSHHSPTRKVPPSIVRHPSVTKMCKTRTAVNLHVFDIHIARAYHTTILDQRVHHTEPCAAAADELVWQRVYGAYQERLV